VHLLQLHLLRQRVPLEADARLLHRRGSIAAAKALARRAEDKAKVDRYIEEGPGFARVNQMMERELRRTAVKESWALPIGYGCCICFGLGYAFEPCCPRYNPCGCFMQVC